MEDPSEKRNVAYIARTNSLSANEPDEKRNVAYIARMNSKALEAPDEKKNVAYLARTNSLNGGPPDNKRNDAYVARRNSSDLDAQDEKRNVAYLARTNSKTMEDSPTEDKRNVAHFAKITSDNLTSNDSLEAEKRHLSSLARANDLPMIKSQEKRYLGALMKSHPPSFIGQGKRYFAAPFAAYRSRNDYDKRFYGSLLKAETPFLPSDMKAEQDKRHIASLIKSQSLPFYPDKRYYASLLKNRDYFLPSQGEDHDQDKRYYGSILKNLPGPLGDEDYIDKRYYSSLLKNLPPADLSKNVEEKSSNGLIANKRYLASLLKSRDSGLFTQNKRHISSLLKGKKSDDSLDEIDEDKRYYASLLKDKKFDDSDDLETEKRYLASLYTKKSDDDEYNEDKRHYASLLSKKSDDAVEETSEDKRHIASLLSKKSDFTDEINEDKRYFASLLDKRDEDSFEDNNDDKRYYASILHKKSEDSFDETSEEKRHYSSLLKHIAYENALDDVLQKLKDTGDQMNTEKRYYASLLNKRSDSEEDQEDSPYEKRYLASLLKHKNSDDFTDGAEKRYFASLLKDRENDLQKRHLASALRAYGDPTAGKRYFASLLKHKDADEDDLEVIKRYYASILKRSDSADADEASQEETSDMGYDDQFNDVDNLVDAQDQEKRHIASLLQSKSSLKSFDDKRHIASLMQNRQSAFGPSTGKRHISSFMRNRQSSFSGGPVSDDAKNHPRRKRYVGSLAKNNDLAFLYSRSRQNRREAPNTREDNVAYLERLIRLKIQNGLMREKQRQNLLGANAKMYVILDDIGNGLTLEDDRGQGDKRNIQALARNGASYANWAGKRLGEDDEMARNAYYPADVYYLATEEAAPRTLNKRFLGSLARSSWFPRQYRKEYDGSDIRKRASPAEGLRAVDDEEEDENNAVDMAMGDTGAFYTYDF
nr:uncharacterized protein LOC113802790 [Penaeus vannamei]